MPTKIYQHDETAIVWQDTGSSPDHLFTLTSLATLTGHQGIEHNFGTGARADRFVWRAWVQFDTNPNQSVVRVYLKTGDGTIYDNDDAAGDNDVSAELKLNNLWQIGTIVVDELLLDITMSASGVIAIPYERVIPVFFNATDDSLRDVANVHGFSLTPVPMESQEA